MFKPILLFSILLFTCQTILANKVDDLKTDEDVVKFITSLDEMFTRKHSRPLLLLPPEETMKSSECGDIKDWSVKKWEKIDINNDGRNDILVNANWYDKNDSFVAVDLGNDVYKLIRLYYSVFDKNEIVKTANINGLPAILFHYNLTVQKIGTRSIEYIKVPVIDTLVYKFDCLIEQNNLHSKSDIESIEFNPPFGEPRGPISIKIDKSGAAILKRFDEPGKDIFKTVIKQKQLVGITDLLKYINVKQLHDSYKVSWFDAPECTLKVSFADGSVKTIKDYGMVATFGLRKIYDLFFDLTNNQDWK